MYSYEDEQGLMSFGGFTLEPGDFLDHWYHNVLALSDMKITLKMYRQGETAPVVSIVHDYSHSGALPGVTVYDKLGVFSVGLFEGSISGHIDNISFTQVPEPFSLSLLAAGTLVLARRRRV